ncbi:MAG: ATP-binding cassette domain-containing protein [Candidatus Zixiibacteriota bacterium]
MNSPAALVQNLCKSFGAHKAVNDVSFEIKHGEVFGFLGPNGSGKTTTIRMLCGILPPTSGTGQTLGLDITRQSELIKSRIGYMSQKFSLYDDLTVLENLRFYAGVQSLPKATAQRRVSEMLELAGLSERRRQLTGQLSGGWKQRLALACALIHEPQMIFLDEPTAGVDPVSRRRFWDMIYRISESGATFLVTTHYMDEAEQFDRMIIIDEGSIIADGAPVEIKAGSFHHTLWEIDCAPLARAADTLRNQAGVANISIPGNVLHVSVTDDTGAGELRDALTESGVTVRSIKRTEPSLEDVFVNLTQEGAAETVRG